MVREAAKKSYPPPSSLVATTIFRIFFSSFKKSSFFLVAKPFPSPLLGAGPFKKTFFAASLIWRRLLYKFSIHAQKWDFFSFDFLNRRAKLFAQEKVNISKWWTNRTCTTCKIPWSQNVPEVYSNFTYYTHWIIDKTSGTFCIMYRGMKAWSTH